MIRREVVSAAHRDRICHFEATDGACDTETALALVADDAAVNLLRYGLVPSGKDSRG
jgi:hypothetical protein